MPTYRIILEPGQKDAPHRRPRGESALHRPDRPVPMTLRAADLAEAVALSTQPQSRIISVEEVEPTIQLDDDQLLEKLSQDEAFDLEDAAESLSDESPTGMIEFEGIVTGVINTLSNTEVIPGLTYSLQVDVDCAYIMLELFDPAAGRYISTGQDITDLIEDRTTQGEAAVLSIARAIISAVNIHLR